MEKHKIIVPKGIRYIGEIDETTKKRKWSDFNLSDRKEPHIINKVLTGCGFTEYCIKCPIPIILISPRRFLLENKEEQHLGEVYYFRNDDEVSTDYELDIGDDKKSIGNKAKTMEEGKNETIENLTKIKDKLKKAYINHRNSSFKPFKILVTYDSFKHVKDALQHVEGSDELDKFYVVVDEFQSIFIDARFKSEAEIELLRALNGIKKVCYVSATPMLDTYLEMLDEFRDLPYYEFDWETEEPGRIIKPWIDVRFTTNSLNSEAKKIIDNYKDGKFETCLDEKTGNLIESKEAVIFMNSVKAICQVIKTNMLHTDQVNVICAKTTDNESKVRAAFNEVLKKETEELMKHPKVPKEYEVIGKIPTKGQPHKTFTLCTRTVYLGADFYSTNAQTFIFSDSNIASLSVDISMDLEQILGRQRLKENPWKNCATMFVKTTDKKHRISKEDYDKEINRKINRTNDLLSVYQNTTKDSEKYSLADTYLTVAETRHYKDNYVSVSIIEKNWKTGEVLWLEPEFNQLMLVSEKRAFDVQQIDYKDRFSVFGAIDKKGLEGVTLKSCELAVDFNDLPDSNSKLRMLVGLKEIDGITEKDINAFLELIQPKYKRYYVIMGPEFIKRFSCKEAEIKREWENLKANTGIQEEVNVEIYKIFEVGKRYTKADIKETLKGLYGKLGYQKTAKATDLEEYFELKPILTPDKKHGVEILGKR